MSGSQPTILSTEGIRSILKNAVLAPSSHNTQPWRFKVSDKTVSLYADRKRALPVNDPVDRELTISCGCALLNLRVAAAQSGFRIKFELLPESTDPDLLAVADLDKSEDLLPDTELFKAIVGRRTYRKPFESREVPPSVVQQLYEAAGKEGAWLKVIDSKANRQEVAARVAEGDAIQWSNPDWRRELADWMHPRRRGDGLTVPGLVAPLVQIVVRSFDMGNRVGAKDKKLAEEAPILATLGTDSDEVADWLKAGQALERVLLKAHSYGLQGSYLNQPIQVATIRPKLQHLLGLVGYPQILLRLGYPGSELPATPRRHLDEVIA